MKFPNKYEHSTDVTVYRVFPSDNGHAISAEFNGSVEITHYDNDGNAHSRAYGTIPQKQYRRFKIQICPVKEMYLIAGYVNLDNAAAIMCSSYPIDNKKCKNIKNKLFLEFDDTTNERSPFVFTAEKAKAIKSFIDSLSQDIKALYVCCDSGESRSAAISAAIMRYLKMNDDDIWMNPHYHPNPLVYKIQCMTFGILVTSIGIKNKIKKNKKAFRNIQKRNERRL